MAGAPPTGCGDGRILVGICAMNKKVLAPPMQQLIRRLPEAVFDVIVFGDDVILGKPIEEWPAVECLMSFFSDGFPLRKAQAYVKLRKPYCVNDLDAEDNLRDRRQFYRILRDAGLPVARHLVLNRDPGTTWSTVVEDIDSITVDGQKLRKPFVEKPVDAEDHNVYIYYPESMGGGSKRMFRKVKNVSSRSYPDVNECRKEGSYIYEKYVMTGGSDIKVYTVGPDYAHAEARKSPSLDGVVQRDKDGKEARFPILLSRKEKEMCRRIVDAFRMNICGFDLLRTPSGESYVCDVNGWSFVKKSQKYYDDCADILCAMMFRTVRPGLEPPKEGFAQVLKSPVVQPRTTKPSESPGSGPGRRQLRCVIGIIRHGDRSPKAKLKLKCSVEGLLQLHAKHAARPDQTVVLKKAQALNQVATILADAAAVEPDSERCEQLQQLRRALLQGGDFRGINRKVNLKPIKWSGDLEESESSGEDSDSSPVSSEDERPRVLATELLVAVKWGGVLTHSGRIQAERLGQWFRQALYPGESMGLLRLHSTFRHDLKLYSSNEGRVQTTAAAFAKGLLDLEGPLTPILASLVRLRNTDSMLDHTFDAADNLKEARRVIVEYGRVKDGDDSAERLKSLMKGQNDSFIKRARTLAPSPHTRFFEVYQLMVKLIAKLDGPTSPLGRTSAGGLMSSASSSLFESQAGRCRRTPFMMRIRWEVLLNNFYNPKKQQFDLTHIPNIYDSAKFDCIHNMDLAGREFIVPLYQKAFILNCIVVPLQYGETDAKRSETATLIGVHLLQKIHSDIATTITPEKPDEPEEPPPIIRPSPKRTTDPYVRSKSTEIRPPPVPDRWRSSTPTHRATSSESKSEDLKGLTTPRRRRRIKTPIEHQDSQIRLLPGLSTDPDDQMLRTPRSVKTRLYFTSESHIFSICQVLRTLESTLGGKVEPILPKSSIQYLEELGEMDYLSHLLIRIYEISAPGEEESRFEAEIMISPGASAPNGEIGPVPKLPTLERISTPGSPVRFTIGHPLVGTDGDDASGGVGGGGGGGGGGSGASGGTEESGGGEKAVGFKPDSGGVSKDDVHIDKYVQEILGTPEESIPKVRTFEKLATETPALTRTESVAVMPGDPKLHLIEAERASFLVQNLNALGLLGAFESLAEYSSALDDMKS